MQILNENVILTDNVIVNNNLIPIKKPKNNTDFIMPTRENYSILLSQNYTIKHLKEIVAHYKIKLGGVSVKADIILKIYNHFKLYDKAEYIQKVWRKYLFKRYNTIRGPARFNRKLCVNETDFFTMDDIKDIPYAQFYSFKDTDNMIYGFDIMSIYNLFDKGFEKITNPYNRNPFPKEVKKNMLKIIWMGRLFKDTISLTMTEEEPAQEQASMTNIENRIISLFNDIDNLGNYTSVEWFLALEIPSLIRFMIELNDIWTYRANLSEDVRLEICPNYRNLFRLMYYGDMRSCSVPMLREIALSSMDMLVRTGINHDSRCLGTNYVLCALTMVSPAAAIALPWLYQSVI